MTLILALACAEGIVVAADRQATFASAGQPTRVTEDKLWQLGDAPVVVGFSGVVGIAQNINAALDKPPKKYQKQSIVKSRGEFNKRISKVLKDAQRHFVRIDPKAGEPECDTLIAGYTEGEPWILEINRNGIAEQHEHRGFHAIGSGEVFARFACAFMYEKEVRNLGLFPAQALAYRTIATAIDVAAWGLGGPIQMWVVDSKDVCRMDERQLQAVRDAVELWKKNERESLIEVVQPQHERAEGQEEHQVPI